MQQVLGGGVKRAEQNEFDYIPTEAQNVEIDLVENLDGGADDDWAKYNQQVNRQQKQRA
jgi:hypothetical protein